MPEQGRRQSITGAATLLLTIVLLTLSTLIIIFAANYGKMHSRSIANINRGQQAFEAAQAGIEFGINYLNTNSTTIADPSTAVSGFLPVYSDANTTNVTLSNGSKFSVTYTNQIANNYELIKITSVGVSDDDTASRTSIQLVQFGSLLLNSPTVPLTSKGNISLSGNSQIINIYNDTTILSALSVALSGAAETITDDGVSSTASATGPDITENIASLATQSSSDFFTSYFGISEDQFKTLVEHYFTNSGNTNYQSDLSGLSGTSIWIDQTGGTATISGNIVVGTATAPVILIINGNTQFSGTVTIYGYVFVMGNTTTDLTGNVNIIGSLTTSNDLNATGSIQVNFSPTVLDNLQNSSNMRYYAKVPGSWKDF